ncbi:tetratricopeptide repeat protein, partial [Bradyrhizobium diazoefficiens]|uniref:tetratricopeptide repeat protein n=2 Tax=Nitrobacteraceae TaxID=41294 RepID=UPI0030B2004A
NGQSPDPAGDLSRADELSQQAVGLDPNNAAAHALRARALQAQKRQKEAAEQYRISLQINGNIATTTLFLARRLSSPGNLLTQSRCSIGPLNSVHATRVLERGSLKWGAR